MEKMTIERAVNYVGRIFRNEYVGPSLSGIEFLEEKREFYAAIAAIIYAARRYPGPDWHAAPAEANYWKMEENGESFYYEENPDVERWIFRNGCRYPDETPIRRFPAGNMKMIQERPADWPKN